MYNLAQRYGFLPFTTEWFSKIFGEKKFPIPLASLIYVFDTFYSIKWGEGGEHV